MDKELRDIVNGTPAPPRQTRERRPRPPTPPKPTAARGKRDYTEGINGLFQLPAGALAIAAYQTNNVKLGAAALVITDHAPNIASATNEVAQEHEAFAKIVEWVLQVGPYGKLFAASLPMVVQLAVIFERIPAGFMGTVPAEAYVARFMAQQNGGGSGNGQPTSDGQVS
jgi:hypothetical protein